MVAWLVGTVISMGLGIVPIGKLHTRMLYSDICKAPVLDENIKLSDEALEELLFWKHCFGQFNGQPIWPVPPDVTVVTYSDASATEWGGFSVNVKGILPSWLAKKINCKGVHFCDSYLFRKVVNTSSCFRSRDQKLSYSRALELLRKVLQLIHLDEKYGLHSMRSGGASLAAALGIPDRLIMRQGSWRSVCFKTRYIRESKASLLEVSRVFNL